MLRLSARQLKHLEGAARPPPGAGRGPSPGRARPGASCEKKRDRIPEAVATGRRGRRRRGRAGRWRRATTWSALRQAVAPPRREDGRAPGLRPQVVGARVRRVDRRGGGHRPAAAGLRRRGLPDPLGLDDPDPGDRRSHLRLEVLLRHRHPLHPPEAGAVRPAQARATSSCSGIPLDPEVDYIKRVVALPGEKVEVRKNEIFIDGRPMPREHVQGALQLRGRPASGTARAQVRAVAGEPGRPAAHRLSTTPTGTPDALRAARWSRPTTSS